MIRARSAGWHWYFIAALLLVLAIVHSSLYYVLTSRIEAALPAFVSTAAEHGWRLQSAAPERTGWPWSSSITLPHVVATSSIGTAVSRWTAERVDLRIEFVDFDTLVLVPAGNQTLEVSSWTPIQLRAGFAQLHVPLSAQSPATLDVRDLAITSAGTEVQVQRVQADLAPLAATLTVDGVGVRPALPAPFDGQGRASVRSTTTVSFGAGSAAGWRSAGGQVALTDFMMQWGPLTAGGNGTGRLDDRLQPEGRATLRVKGGTELLDALARAGVIAAAPAAAARAVLGLLGLAAQGQPVSLPLALVDRTVTVAQFPLLRLPMIGWNAR